MKAFAPRSAAAPATAAPSGKAVAPADNRPAAVAQRQLQATIAASPRQAAPVQLAARRRNTTGLPDQLKAGVESLSGHSLDDVKVHYNSAKPAQLQALAYAQGTDIHIGPGQEKHLPHEAWHVVQQKQGRVRPTRKIAGVAVNTSSALEAEADLMTTHVTTASAGFAAMPILLKAAVTSAVVQRVGGESVGYDPKVLAEGSEFKKDVKALFDIARKYNKMRKSAATKQNTNKLAGIPGKLLILGTELTVAKNAKNAVDIKRLEGEIKATTPGKQVKGDYALGLSTINLDAELLGTLLNQPAAVKGELDSLKQQSLIEDADLNLLDEVNALQGKLKIDNGVIVAANWPANKGALPEAKILAGDAVFEELPQASPLARQVYRKQGKEDGETNEYVRDDLDKYTRRYAYMEKNFHQFADYQAHNMLTGKTQYMIGAATGRKGEEVNPLNFKEQHITNAENKIIPSSGVSDKEKLAYMHQAKGSGPGQRGLSLTSTSKEDAVYGNAGESFKTTDGAKFKIDLAKIEQGPTNLLINHYRTDSTTRSRLEGTRLDVSRLGNNNNRLLGGHYQYERSVIKNRELYLRNLPSAAVVSVTPHQASAGVQQAGEYNAQKSSYIAAVQVRGKLNLEKKNLTAKKTDLAVKLSAEENELQTNQVQVADARTQVTNAQQAVHNSNQPLAECRIELDELDKNRDRKKGQNGKESPFEFWTRKTSNAQKAVDSATVVLNRENKRLQQLETHVAALEVKVNKLRTEGASVDQALLAVDDKLALAAAIPAQPTDTPANKYARQGWASGQSFEQGYQAGLLGYQAALAEAKKSHKPLEKVETLFKAAYKDQDQHTTYWEGYGAALHHLAP